MGFHALEFLEAGDGGAVADGALGGSLDPSNRDQVPPLNLEVARLNQVGGSINTFCHSSFSLIHQ